MTAAVAHDTGVVTPTQAIHWLRNFHHVGEGHPEGADRARWG